MKRYLTSHWSMAAIAATVALFSCKDDEDPVIPVVSFQQATQTVGEAAGTINVVLQLDVNAPREIKVRYTLGGTAAEGTTTSSDYQVLGTYGEVTIAEGASSATLQLQIKQDEAVEADETIIVTINDVVNETATVGATPSTTITLQSDDQGAKVSFNTATTTINESDGLLEIQLTLDKPAGQDLTVDYKFNYDFAKATAIDTVWAYNHDPQVPSQYYDFYVVGGTYGKLAIPAGSTTAKLTIQLISDFLWDEDEMIELTLSAVSTGGQLGTNTKHTVTVKQQDGRLIGLVWPQTVTDVDMDLIVWIGEDEASFTALSASINEGTTPQSEEVFIPTVFSDLINDEFGGALFGVSCIYYDGETDPLNFEVHHVDFAEGEFEDSEVRDIKPGVYTIANRNQWQTLDDVQIEHTFELASAGYTNLSEIIIPTSGSRRATYQIPAKISKNNVRARFASKATTKWSRK